MEELEAVFPGGQKGTAIPADGVFLSNLGLVGAVAILSPSTQLKQCRYYTKLNDDQSVTYPIPSSELRPVWLWCTQKS